jgi:hypothetical protein
VGRKWGNHPIHLAKRFKKNRESAWDFAAEAWGNARGWAQTDKTFDDIGRAVRANFLAREDKLIIQEKLRDVRDVLVSNGGLHQAFLEWGGGFRKIEDVILDKNKKGDIT